MILLYTACKTMNYYIPCGGQFRSISRDSKWPFAPTIPLLGSSPIDGLAHAFMWRYILTKILFCVCFLFFFFGMGFICKSIEITNISIEPVIVVECWRVNGNEAYQGQEYAGRLFTADLSF